MSAVRTTCPYCGVGCGLLAAPAGAGTTRTVEANRGAPSAVPPVAPIARGALAGGVAVRSGRPGWREPVRGAAAVEPFRHAEAWHIAGDPEHPANRGRVCSKGAALAETLTLEGRLLHPEIGGRRACWDEALAAVAKGFARTVEKHGPDAVAFYVSGQLLTEDYYVANKLMKGFIGGANIDTNSRLCMASAVAGYQRAFGEDVVPNGYHDLEAADLLVVVGANMAWCHPVLFQRIAARRPRGEVDASRLPVGDSTRSGDRGRPRVVVIDPRRTATCDIADLFLPIRPGTDVVLFSGLLNYLRREDAVDWDFLEAHTEGFGAAMRAAKDIAPSVPAVAAACDLPESDVARFYHWFARTPRAMTLFSQGVNQSSSGTDKVNGIINVHLATGRVGRPGAGPFSLTGQPNAMGGREVGALANQLAAHMDFSPEHVERVGRFWEAPAIARRPGLKAVELFEAVAAARVRAVWIMSTNPTVSMPDADRVREALGRCELVVVSDCVRRTDTAACADVLLPAAAWGEKSGTVTNSERRISRQRAFLPAPGESRPDWWIVTQVARRMGFAKRFPYEQPVQIFREHARLSGFENARTRAFDIGALAALDDAGYEALEPVRWPLPAGGDAPDLFPPAGRFFTPSGKARFVALKARAPVDAPSARHPLILNTGRVRDHWHTMTRTGASPRLSAHHVEPFVQVSRRDARRAGVRHGELAELSNARGRMVARALVSDDVQPGQLFAPIHWNDAFSSRGRVGALIGAAVDPVSGQPELKHAAVALRRFAPAWHGFVLSRTRLCRLETCAYWALAKGRGFWRYELAGDSLPDAWSDWARALVGDGEEWVELADAAGGRYRGASLQGGKLNACVFVSSTAALPAREWLGTLFAAEALDDDSRLALLAGRPARGRPNGGPVVCACFSIGRAALLSAIRTASLVSAEQIGQALGAGTNCGSCLPELNALLAQAAPAE